jgi:Dirigent-like protein
MTKRLAVIGVAVAAASGLLAAFLTPASSQQAGTQTIRVCDQNKPGFNKHVDVGKKHFSAGDFNLFTDVLRNPKTGAKHGRDAGRLTLLKRRNGSFILDATFIFPTGKITVYGVSKFANFTKAAFAVTGGTGRFRNAGGTLNLSGGKCNGKAGLHLTLNLTL